VKRLFTFHQLVDAWRKCANSATSPNVTKQ